MGVLRRLDHQVVERRLQFLFRAGFELKQAVVGRRAFEPLVAAVREEVVVAGRISASPRSASVCRIASAPASSQSLSISVSSRTGIGAAESGQVNKPTTHTRAARIFMREA